MHRKGRPRPVASRDTQTTRKLTNIHNITNRRHPSLSVESPRNELHASSPCIRFGLPVSKLISHFRNFVAYIAFPPCTDNKHSIRYSIYSVTLSAHHRPMIKAPQSTAPRIQLNTKLYLTQWQNSTQSKLRPK